MPYGQRLLNGKGDTKQGETQCFQPKLVPQISFCLLQGITLVITSGQLTLKGLWRSGCWLAHRIAFIHLVFFWCLILPCSCNNFFFLPVKLLFSVTLCQVSWEYPSCLCKGLTTPWKLCFAYLFLVNPCNPFHSHTNALSVQIASEALRAKRMISFRGEKKAKHSICLDIFIYQGICQLCDVYGQYW